MTQKSIRLVLDAQFHVSRRDLPTRFVRWGVRFRPVNSGKFRPCGEPERMAIYDHRLPADGVMPEILAERRGALTDVVVREVEAVLPADAREKAPRLARSLVATVHGHCTFALNGSFTLLGETDPLEMAMARVKESLAAAGAQCLR